MTRARIVLLVLVVGLLAGCDLFDFGPGFLFEETFSGTTTDWFTGEDQNRRAWLEEAKYHLLVKITSAPILMWRNQVGPFDDFRLEIDTEQIGGPDNNGYGVCFRMLDANNHYRFLVSGDGFVRFDKRVNGQTTALRGWEASSAVNQGVAANHITIIAQGDTFTFYVNSVELFTFTDGEYDSGFLGVSAVQYGSAGQTHVAFDNFTLEALE